MSLGHCFDIHFFKPTHFYKRCREFFDERHVQPLR